MTSSNRHDQTGDLRPRVGFPRETTPGDRRTLLTPSVAAQLDEAGFDVQAERGIAEGVHVDDTELAACGVTFTDADAVWTCPLVLRYRAGRPDELARLGAGQAVAALFHAEGDPELLAVLAKTRTTAYAFEFLADEDGNGVSSRPGGEIAGVQAVLAGAHALQSHLGGRGVLLAAVDGAPRARVVVIGSGNVGATAARTAAALGADVTVLTRTSAATAAYQAAAPAGVAVRVNSPEVRGELLPATDLLVGAILVSTYGTPPMVTAEDVNRMPAGAVVVDATCGYGPDGYLPTAGPVQRPGDPPFVVGGVLHVKLDALPSLVPLTATAAYTAAVAPFLVRTARHVLQGVPDTVVESGLLVRGGVFVHPVVLEHAEFYGLLP